METYKFMFIFFHILVVFTSISAEDTCQTPDHHQGICKSITECPSLLKFVREIAKRPDQNVAEHLQKSQCGFSGVYPKVCCPNAAINISDQARNSHLLPNNSVCGNFPEDRILSDGTSLGDFPWTVLLRYGTADDRKEIYCGGVLISERYVLTAAHCIQGPNLPRNAKLISVRLGEYNLETNPDCERFVDAYVDCFEPFLDASIEETIVHEDYNSGDPNQYHDIALIRLQKKIDFNDFVRPICLFATTQGQPNNTRYTTAGWGVDGTQIKYTTKKKSRVQGKYSETCEDAFKVKLSQNQICAGKIESVYVCDGGGSLMEVPDRDYHYYAAGVTSFGSCNTESLLVVYTRVDQYKNWIISKLKH